MTTLVLLHSWGTSSDEWSLVRPGLRAPSVAFDLPGSGEAPPISDRQTVAQLADAVGEKIAGLSDYRLVGHSMGGKVAMALAARRPVGLRGLVLVAPSPLSPEPMTEEAREGTLRSFGIRAEIEGTVDTIVRRPISPELRERVVGEYLRTSPEAWRAWMEVGSREDLSALAAEIDVPTLVIAGGEDPVMAREMLEREVVGTIRGARFEIIPDSGHLIPIEAPVELTALLNALN